MRAKMEMARSTATIMGEVFKIATVRTTIQTRTIKEEALVIITTGAMPTRIGAHNSNSNVNRITIETKAEIMEACLMETKIATIVAMSMQFWPAMP